jgi:hypothetical protein
VARREAPAASGNGCGAIGFCAFRRAIPSHFRGGRRSKARAWKRVAVTDAHGHLLAVEAFEDWNVAVAAPVMRYNPRAAKER